MHQLLFLRHAQAEPPAAGGADHDRPLSPRGQADAAAIGRAMRQAGLQPDVVLVSPALRTQQTLAALQAAKLWDERPNIDTLPLLYMATAARLRDLLRDLPETARSALLISHNPGVHELARSLSGPVPMNPALSRLATAYPTAALAEFLITTPWRKLGPGAAALQRFLPPSDLA